MSDKNNKSNSERTGERKAFNGWDPAFFSLSEAQRIKNKAFLVRLGKERIVWV